MNTSEFVQMFKAQVDESLASQTEIAEALGISQPNLQQMWTVGREPRWARLEAIAKMLGCRLSLELIKEPDYENFFETYEAKRLAETRARQERQLSYGKPASEARPGYTIIPRKQRGPDTAHAAPSDSDEKTPPPPEGTLTSRPQRKEAPPIVVEYLRAYRAFQTDKSKEVGDTFHAAAQAFMRAGYRWENDKIVGPESAQVEGSGAQDVQDDDIT